VIAAVKRSPSSHDYRPQTTTVIPSGAAPQLRGAVEELAFPLRSHHSQSNLPIFRSAFVYFFPLYNFHRISRQKGVENSVVFIGV
jgi:hypothetical protein